MMRFFLMALFFLICFFLFSAGIVRAEPWPKVAFANWPSIPVEKIKSQEPPIFPLDVPGSVLSKPKPPDVRPRLCNERQPLGFWLLVRCSFPRSSDLEQSLVLNSTP